METRDALPTPTPAAPVECPSLNPLAPVRHAMFTRQSLWLSTIRHFARSYLTVVLGVALATAVITGALIVGDSVRDSLRRMSLERLGSVDFVVRGPRFFRQDLAQRLSKEVVEPVIAPAIVVPGSVQTGTLKDSSTRRAGHVEVYAVNAAFWQLAGVPAPPDGLAISRRLADQLQLRLGDSASVIVEIPPTIPRDALLGEREETVVELPLTVSHVFPDNAMPGRFGLNPSQQLPLNAFVSLEQLQAQLGLQFTPASPKKKLLEKPARVNALFIGHTDSVEPQLSQMGPEMAERITRSVHQQIQLDDLSLRIVPHHERGLLSIESERMFLDDSTVAAAEKIAAAHQWKTSPVLVYLLNEMANPSDPSRYSMYSIAAGLNLDTTDTFGPFEFLSGQAPQADDEVALNEWLATDTGLTTGDKITLKYHMVGDRGELPELTKGFRVTGVVRLTGGAADRGLTPQVSGVTDAETYADWREPFPLKKDRITDRDDEYWKQHKTTPKVFLSLAGAESHWKSRYGQRTSIRIAIPEGRDPEAFATDFQKQWLAAMDRSITGMAAEPIKLQGLLAAQGTTDFTGLFIGFSLFLIASALMLVSLLFRLGLEQRGRELGILLGVGWPPQLVRRQVLSQGLVMASTGGLVGVGLGVGYAQLMIHGLTTWWSGAVGTQGLTLSVRPHSLVIGWLVAVLVAVFLIMRAGRQLTSAAPRQLLTSGGQNPVTIATNGATRHFAFSIAVLTSGLLLLAGLLGLVPTTEAFAGFSWRTIAFFLGGISSLAAGLLGLGRWLAVDRGSSVAGQGRRAWLTLALRNAARNRARSLLTTSLIASATFLVVAVASGRRNPAVEAPRRDSGNGGYSLVAETNQPLLFDLNSPSGRTRLGINLRHREEAETLLTAARFTALRVRPGENASCLNLYQTQMPTILGLPQRVIDQFAAEQRFKFADTRSRDPWRLLAEPASSAGPIPVLGDMNTLQYSLHKGIGAMIEIEDAQRQKRSLIVRGMLDGSVFQGVLLMSEEHLLQMFPETAGYRYFLIEVDPAQANVLTTLLESDLADTGFDAERVADRLADFLAVQNTYLSTFQTLGALGLLLGTVGLGVVMMRNVWERRSELALLRAVGFTTPTLRWIVLLENACLLGFGLTVGTLAAAVAMAPHLLSISADVSWLGLAATILAVFVAGMASSLAAVREVSRLPILEALRANAG